jgi:hypothetical protein
MHPVRAWMAFSPSLSRNFAPEDGTGIGHVMYPRDCLALRIGADKAMPKGCDGDAADRLGFERWIGAINANRLFETMDSNRTKECGGFQFWRAVRRREKWIGVLRGRLDEPASLDIEQRGARDEVPISRARMSGDDIDGGGDSKPSGRTTRNYGDFPQNRWNPRILT